MKFTVFDVMDKGLYLRQALEQAGHTPSQLDQADLLLLDCDWEWALPRPQLIEQAAGHAKIALYPHGGQPTAFVYDGLTPPNPLVDLRLEHGPGSLNLVQADLKQRAFGWLYSPTKPFTPIDEPRRILFAPLHPNIEALQNRSNGTDPAPKLNRHVFHQLVRSRYDVNVSVVGPLWKNGIWFHPSARMISNPEMRFTHSYDLVQQADLVIAAGTIAAAAVASGKPTIFLGGHDCSDYIGGKYVRAEHADEYQDKLRYPLNCEDGPLADLIHKACQGSQEAASWRTMWVGDDGASQEVAALERLVASSTANVTIAGATARSGART